MKQIDWCLFKLSRFGPMHKNKSTLNITSGCKLTKRERKGLQEIMYCPDKKLNSILGCAMLALVLWEYYLLKLWLTKKIALWRKWSCSLGFGYNAAIICNSNLRKSGGVELQELQMNNLNRINTVVFEDSCLNWMYWKHRAGNSLSLVTLFLEQSVLQDLFFTGAAEGNKNCCLKL